MCGRYVLTPSGVAMVPEHFGLDGGELPDYEASWNHAPSALTPVVGLRKDGSRGLALLRWGLVPSWSREEKPARAPINARAETVAEKPSFRAAFRARRCLVPASGWYEWQELVGGGKQPWLLWPAESGSPADGGLCAFAGIWETRPGADGPHSTFAILTLPAREEVAAIHPRMPVVLRPQEYPLWLGEGAAGDPADLLVGVERPALVAHPVGSQVNSPRHAGPDCILRAGMELGNS